MAAARSYVLPAFLVATALSTAAIAEPVTPQERAAAQPAGTVGNEAGHDRYRATSRRRFDDVEHWTKVFDAPERDAWQKPQEVVGELAIAEGATVVDLGAGTGYFAPYLATAVGATGQVIAVETEPNLVAHLRERAEAEGLANLTPVLGSFDNPRLARAGADLILIVDTFHHIDDRRGYFEGLARALRPGGRVAVIDWKKAELPEGPPPPHKLPREQVVREMESAGYRLVAEPALLPYQYFLIFSAR